MYTGRSLCRLVRVQDQLAVVHLLEGPLSTVVVHTAAAQLLAR